MALREEWSALDSKYDAEFQAFLDNPEATNAEYLGSMNKEQFHDMARELTILDTEYDNFFQDFLDSPSTHTSEKLAQFKDMQGRIYPLEEEMYTVAERFFSPEKIQQLKAQQERLFEIEVLLYKVAEGTMKIQD